MPGLAGGSIGRRTGPPGHGCLVADEGEADRLPLMALGPAMTTPGDGRTVAVRCSSGGCSLTEQSPIAGRPVFLNIALGLVLLGMAGSLTVVLVVVQAPSAHRRPPVGHLWLAVRCRSCQWATPRRIPWTVASSQTAPSKIPPTTSVR
jgi:hypothetical protein